VIQQDGGERSAALRAPQHRVQGSRPTMDDYGFWPARSLAPGRRYVSAITSGTRTNAYIFVIWRPQSLDTTDAADSVGMRPYIVIAAEKTCTENQWSKCRSVRLKKLSSRISFVSLSTGFLKS